MLQQLFHGSPQLEMEFLKLGCIFLTPEPVSWTTQKLFRKNALRRKYCGVSPAGLSMLLSKLRKIISPFTLFKHFLAMVSWSSAKNNHLKFCLWFVHKSSHTFKRSAKKNIWRMCELIMNPIYFKNVHLVNSWNVVYNGNTSRLSWSGSEPPASKPLQTWFLWKGEN